ncbi:unnamed protein product, partial [Gulo gulo]
PLSCRSSASGVPGSWHGGPGLSCDTITYYKAQKNSGKLWMGGKQALTNYEALSVEINSQTFWAGSGGVKFRDSVPDILYEKQRSLPIPITGKLSRSQGRPAEVF